MTVAWWTVSVTLAVTRGLSRRDTSGTPIVGAGIPGPASWQDRRMAHGLLDPERCVAHPSRPAVDHCPVCERPRCGADATGPGCAVCGGALVGARRPASDAELVVRAALACHVIALVAGVGLQEY